MGEDSDDVILVFEEKKFIENINYAVWPGDINHEERERAKKRKRDNEGNSNNNNEEADTNDKDEDPIHNLNKRACLSNRYFSSENTIKLVSGDKSTTTSTRQTFTRNNAASGENDDFVRRRDYLMKKLLQSRTLPNLDEDQQTQLPPSKSSVEIPVEITSKKSSGEDVEKKPTPLMTNKSLPTTSSSSFNVNDEFIPLRSAETPTTSTSENRETPSTPLENVNGCNLRPYPRDSINRVKDHLKYLFSENSPFALYESNQAQRTFEIVKLKLGLNSKFANDPSVLRRIEREKAEAKRFLQDRFKLIEAKLRRSNPNATCIDLCTTEEEDDDDDDEAEETDEDERDEIMKYIAKEDTINLDDDDDSEDERTSSSEKSDDDEEDDESEKEDSKYYQYGKYSTKKNKGEEVPVIKKGKKVSSISSRVNLSKVKSKGKKQLGNTKGQDLDQLEVDYNALRRRKLNNLKRKKKRTLSKSEFELEKKLINTELRKMRKSMRKMKNKKQKTNQATNSSSSIVSLNSNSKNSTDKYKKRTNKPKRNKSFFIDNSGFNPFRHGANIKKPKGRFFPRFNKYEVLQRNSKKNYNH